MSKKETLISNVARAKERKARNRTNRQSALMAEAKKLGISLSELKLENWQEVQEIRRIKPPVAPSRPAYRGYWD